MLTLLWFESRTPVTSFLCAATNCYTIAKHNFMLMRVCNLNPAAYCYT
jgi:hypothetical protein